MQKIETMNLNFIIRKNRLANGLVTIQMQITIDGETIFFSTSQKIEIDNWEEKTGRAVGKSHSAQVRQKFAQFYPNPALQVAFDTPQSTYNFISQPAN